MKIWVKMEYQKKTISKKTKKAIFSNREAKSLYEFNCSERKLRLLYFAEYNSSGIIISSYKTQEGLEEWEYVIPDSIGAILLNKTCEMFYY